VTEGHHRRRGRAPHVELTPVDRGVSVRTHAGCTAWVAPVGKANRKERHEVSARAHHPAERLDGVLRGAGQASACRRDREVRMKAAEISGGVAATLRVKSTSGAFSPAPPREQEVALVRSGDQTLLRCG
jgi:hypothetical protein